MGETEDIRSPAERRIERSIQDPDRGGQPLSWHARKTRRTVEAYLKAGVIPRYMQRANEIERETALHRRQLEHAYHSLEEACAGDAEAFARRWRERAASWPFDAVNELIREHNEWYPVEAGLPMDPRTRDYVSVRGRSYRRDELGPRWVLQHFPA